MRNARARLRKALRPLYKENVWFKTKLRNVDGAVDRLRHSVARVIPQVIRADPRSMYISLTSHCNLRCKACLYGRDFMPNNQLPLQTVKDLLDDAKALGFERVRLYGGEPLLHSELAEIVAHTASLGLGMWMTTNGIRLKEKADELIASGLRRLSVGFYGTGESYNEYVQRPERFHLMEEGVAYVRERYGMDVFMHLDWLLMRPTCTLESLHETWDFANRYRMPIYVNLLHYSLPYFVHGDQPDLQFRPEDRPLIQEVIDELLRFRKSKPELLLNSEMGLRSIPDWLILGPRMRVPCTEYRLIWVGPDGTVQMCYVTFKLGNLHGQRLRDMLFTPEHHQAARDAFQLNCPNCHCSYDARIQRHAESRKMYG